VRARSDTVHGQSDNVRARSDTVRVESTERAEPATAPSPADRPPDAEPGEAVSSDGERGEPDETLLEAPGRPGEVMRVIRDEQSGRILVEVEGRSYAHLREIADPQAGRRVLWAIADLIRFTGGMAANAQAVQSVAQQVAGEQGLPTPPGPARAEETPARTEEDAAARPGAPEPRPAPEGPDRSFGSRYSISAFFRRGLKPLPSTPEPAPGSFVDEIEAILQDMIGQRAAPLPREVHVSVGSGNRLQVEVGREVYGSAEEVPDPEIRALIQAAVAAWEAR
jgi:hypothetical protein